MGEWIDGPAADPLQLGLRLVIGLGNDVDVDLEVVSGGWSPWADTWALRDETLEARVTIVAALPDGERVLVSRQPHDFMEKGGVPSASIRAWKNGECLGALREALLRDGSD